MPGRQASRGRSLLLPSFEHLPFQCWQLPTHELQPTREHECVSTDIRVLLGNRIRSLRRKNGWTQVEMADILGVDRSYLSEIETGKKDPSLRVLKTIADGFRMSLSQFLSGL